MTYRDVAQKLRTLGCEEISRHGGGSHRKWVNPAAHMATAVPDWGSRDPKLGTIRAIVRQLGLNWEQFRNA